MAPGRAKRPGGAKPVEDELASCPFCGGREDRTPPETLRLDDPWQVRVVPNLYPAVERQEVVIHTPEHLGTIADLDDGRLELVAEAWRQRAAAAFADGLGYVQAIVNEGRTAGASLPHTHSQLASFSEVPPVPAAEQNLSALLDGEVVLERDGVVLLCPRAARGPYELLAAPTIREAAAFESALLGPALALLAEGIRRLRSLVPDVALNLWLHDVGWWHFELLPRLGIHAGLELGAGVYINTVPPEDAAAALREARIEFAS